MSRTRGKEPFYGYRRAFLGAVEKGEAKINASVLFPHDIVHRYGYADSTDTNLEVLWKNLPDTVQGCGNTIVVADGSGSMRVRGSSKLSGDLLRRAFFWSVQGSVHHLL